MLVEAYKGWNIYYSSIPSPLWTATKGMEKDLHSYYSLEKIKEYVDRKEKKQWKQ